MKENNKSSCLAKNKQDQEALLIKHFDEIKKTITADSGPSFVCNCGCNKCVHFISGFAHDSINDQWLPAVELIEYQTNTPNSEQGQANILILQAWFLISTLTTQQLHSLSNIPVEVIKISQDPSTPLCSVLTSGGVVDGVIDLDWQNIGGNPQK